MWYSKLRHYTPAVAGALAGLSGIAQSDRRWTRCYETSFNKDEVRKFPILEVREVAPLTNIIKCALPSPQHVMGMPVTSYVMVSGANSGDASAYTPISTDDQPGSFELLVKGYPTGNVCKYLCGLKPGDTVSLQGPYPKMPYSANMKKKIGMVAGGVGVTPMLQLIREILKNPDDKTEMTLVLGNQTPADICLRDEFDKLSETSNGRLKVIYIVDRNTSNDKDIAHVGYVNPEFLKKTLPAPSNDTLICVCGPPEMLEAIAGKKGFVKGRKFGQGYIGGMLKELGYTIDMVFKF